MCILTGGEYDCCSSSKEGLPENGKQASYYNNLNQARTWEVRTRDANTAHLFHDVARERKQKKVFTFTILLLLCKRVVKKILAT